MVDGKVIGKRIQTIRNRKGMNKTAFCDLVGMCVDTLNAYEGGYQKPNAQILYEIAEKTGFSLDWIYGLSERERIC